VKLYCYKFYDKNENVVDVYHAVAKDNESMHWRLERTLRECRTYGLANYHSYSFFEVNDIDGYKVSLIEIKDEIGV